MLAVSFSFQIMLDNNTRMLSYSTLQHMASWLIGDTRKVELWKVWHSEQALAGGAIACVCGAWSTLMKEALIILREQNKWNMSTKQISSYLTGRISVWHMNGEHCQERAADALPLYSTCSMWKSVLDKPMDMLYHEHRWYDCYVKDCCKWMDSDSDKSS